MNCSVYSCRENQAKFTSNLVDMYVPLENSGSELKIVVSCL